jgi:mono/diheme cytochrome c family protein
LTGLALVAGAFLGLPALPAHAQASRTVRDGVYSDAQAARGGAIYEAQCAACHGASLEGAQAPPLVGDVFVQIWRGEPVSALVNKIRHTMPADSPGQLTPRQSADLAAHLLKAGGFPPGGTELAPDEAAWQQIGWPEGLAAGPAPPMGNLGQLMRGIFFTNSNLIFTVQTRDPGAPAQAPASSDVATGGFSFVDWGAGIYTGWELVDNAAIALAEASPMMLTPGRRCENGKPVPVDDPEWIRLTEEMIEASRVAYRASQSRSQEAVSEATGQLSDACFACHRAYRDRRPRGGAPDPADPSNKAARCVG